MRRFAPAASAYAAVTTTSAPATLQSASVPPRIAPARIAAIVDDSMSPLAFTSLSGDVSSERMPYFAGEYASGACADESRTRRTG